MATPKLEPGRVHQLSPALLASDPAQPRKSIDKASLKELAASLKSIGMKQPIVVRKDGTKIVIVYGERRWRAAKEAKLRTVPCILGDEAEAIDRAAGQIAENVQREALNPADIAAFLARLQKTEKKSVNELVGELAKRGIKEVSHARVEKLLQFNEFPQWVSEHLRAGTLTETHAVHLLQCIPYPKVMAELKAEIKRMLAWTGQITQKDLSRAIENCYQAAGRDLKRSYGDYAVAFSIKVCDGCEFRKSVGGGTYCMNPPEFDRKNKEANALKLERDLARAKGAKGTPAAPSASEVKQRAKRREEITEEKLSAYLDTWLRPRILAGVAERATGLQVYALTWWLATGAVGRASTWNSGQQPAVVEAKTRGLLHQAKLGDLPSVAAYAMNADNKAVRDRGIAQAAVSAMNEEQLRWFARALKVDLAAEGFRIDMNYLNLQKKAELIDLARSGGVVPRGTGGVTALKSDILGTAGSIEKIGVPAAIADLYAKEYETVKPAVFKDHKAPTDHDKLLHELGLDSDAGTNEIVHALHLQSEEFAARAKAEAQKLEKKKTKPAKGKKKTRKAARPRK